jgi:hypothetical protein
MRVALNWPRRDRFDKKKVHYGMSDEEDHRIAASESLVISDCDDRLAELPPSPSVAGRRRQSGKRRTVLASDDPG